MYRTLITVIRLFQQAFTEVRLELPLWCHTVV